MPATRVPYVPQPYVGEPYRDSGTSRSLAALLADRGNQAAAMHLRRGDDAARMWLQAGNVVNDAVTGWQRNVELNRQRELEAARESRRAEAEGLQLTAAKRSLAEAERGDKVRDFTRQILPLARRQDGLQTYDRSVLQREYEAAGMADALPEVFAKLDEQEQAHYGLLQKKREVVALDALRVLQGGASPEAYDGLLQYWEANDVLPKRELEAMRAAGKDPAQLQQALMAAVSSSPAGQQALRQMQEMNAPKLKAYKPGDVVLDERNPQAGPVFSVPEMPKEPANLEAAIVQAMRSGNQSEVDRLVGMKEQWARAGRAPVQPQQEPLVAITGPDGRPVLVPRSEAVGKAPANTREQGRQVTSGDAGDIAEFNTALDDLATLRAELEGNDATGTGAQIGAALWTPITNLTGWGLDAKQKQAQIDRVKQVIGKALEGGVLRKEDEVKYEKILPTIKDDPELVRTKLNGLVTAIQKRQQRKLDALESAGYDVSRFTAQAGGGGMVTMKAPNGQTSQVPADQVEHYKALGAVVVK